MFLFTVKETSHRKLNIGKNTQQFAQCHCVHFVAKQVLGKVLWRLLQAGTEWESVGIWLRPLGNAAYVVVFRTSARGTSSLLNGKSIWLGLGFESQLDPGIFPWIYFLLFQQKKTHKNIIIVLSLLQFRSREKPRRNYRLTHSKCVIHATTLHLPTIYITMVKEGGGRVGHMQQWTEVHPLTIPIRILVLHMHTVSPHPTTSTSHVHPMKNQHKTKSLMKTRIIHWYLRTIACNKRMTLQLTPCTMMVAQTQNSWRRREVARTREMMALVANRAIKDVFQSIFFKSIHACPAILLLIGNGLHFQHLNSHFIFYNQSQSTISNLPFQMSFDPEFLLKWVYIIHCFTTYPALLPCRLSLLKNGETPSVWR